MQNSSNPQLRNTFYKSFLYNRNENLLGVYLIHFGALKRDLFIDPKRQHKNIGLEKFRLSITGKSWQR
jgi:hypothetical protein